MSSLLPRHMEQSARRAAESERRRQLARTLFEQGVAFEGICERVARAPDTVAKYLRGLRGETRKRHVSNEHRRAVRAAARAKRPAKGVPNWVREADLLPDYYDSRRLLGKEGALRHCLQLAAEMRRPTP